MATMDEEKAKMLRGELYYAFTPSLTAEREECSRKCHIFNTTASELSRLERINLWNTIVGNPPLPADTPEEVLDNAPWVEAPFHADYGTNLRFGDNVYINFNCTITDTCVVSIGSRTLIGPNVSLYAATHPLDPELRNGTKGPECGKEITIGEDCWLGGGVTVLPGVTIGKGSVVGAASVVTKDVPEYSVVVGNPARLVRRLRPVEEKVESEDSVGALRKKLESLEAEMKEVKERLNAITGA